MRDNFSAFFLLVVHPVMQRRWFANVCAGLLADSRGAVFQVFG